MNGITYPMIQPLIVQENVVGSTLQVIFRCPVSGQQFSSTATVKAGNMSRMKTAATTSVAYSLRSALSSSVFSMLGGGVAGQVASSALYSAMPTAPGVNAYSYSEDDKQIARVEAFQKVMANFTWSDHHQSFVSMRAIQGPSMDPRAIQGPAPTNWSSAPPIQGAGPTAWNAPQQPQQRPPSYSGTQPGYSNQPTVFGNPPPPQIGNTQGAQALSAETAFAQRMGQTHITSPWDKGVLAKMLVEIATVDGQMGAEEQEFFQVLALAGAPSLEDLKARPPLTEVELSETSPAVRETLLMTAFAMAYADQNMDKRELARLQDFARGLSIPDAKADELARAAREFVIDKVLDEVYADGRMNPDEQARVHALARRLGLDTSSLSRLDVRARKRRGIF